MFPLNQVASLKNSFQNKRISKQLFFNGWDQALVGTFRATCLEMMTKTVKLTWRIRRSKRYCVKIVLILRQQKVCKVEIRFPRPGLRSRSSVRLQAEVCTCQRWEQWILKFKIKISLIGCAKRVFRFFMLRVHKVYCSQPPDKPKLFLVCGEARPEVSNPFGVEVSGKV